MIKEGGREDEVARLDLLLHLVIIIIEKWRTPGQYLVQNDALQVRVNIKNVELVPLTRAQQSTFRE